jgi:hypothetical protein
MCYARWGEGEWQPKGRGDPKASGKSKFKLIVKIVKKL